MLRLLHLLSHRILVDHVGQVRHVERIANHRKDLMPLDERHSHHPLGDRCGDLKKFHSSLLNERLRYSLHAVSVCGYLEILPAWHSDSAGELGIRLEQRLSALSAKRERNTVIMNHITERAISSTESWNWRFR